MTSFSPSPEQQAVIEYPLRPLRVAAGAGSGKTGTMARRLAHLVSSGAVEPEQALGITFTNKAAGELADRVRAAIPEATAEGHEVEITTYHGFAHSLLDEFGPLVGVPRGVRIVTPGYTRQLIRDAIAAGPRPLLDLTQPGRVVDRVARLASTLGDHLRGAADLADAGGGDVQRERAALADVLEAYERRKQDLGVVDFADLVTLAHRLVIEHDGLAERLRDRYRIVLLDEYQDTNPGQRELLRAIFGVGFPVTAVGDTDQTIYEWRGASPDNFERFPVHFPQEDGSPAETRSLSVTWRNDRAIVAVANAVRAEIATPGPLDALVPAEGAGAGTVTAHWASTARDEARWIAGEAERLHDEGTSWREMAVLFRKHRQMAAVRDALVERGIPVEVASLGGLLEVPEIVDLHAWLRVLGRPDDAVALARILTGARYRLGLGDLAPLSRWVASRNHSGPDDEEAIGWALLEAVDELEDVPGMSGEARRRVEAFRLLYRSLAITAQSVNLVELCGIVLDETGVWPEVDAMDDAARLSTRLNLYRFLDLAEEWSPLEGAPSLSAFLDHLELLADEAASDELDTARVSGEDAMPLLTVHRAKGLEWDVAFLPALAHDVFPSRVIQYEDPVTVASVMPRELRLDVDSLGDLPDEHDARRAALKRSHDDQEWRTAYVAVTRARHAVVASGSFWTGGVKPRRPSRLFEIVDDFASPDVDRCRDPGEAPTEGTAGRPLSEAPDPVFAAGWRAAVAASIDEPDHARRLAATIGVAEAYDRQVDELRLQLTGLPESGEPDLEPAPFRTSVTGLVTLAGCALKYQWSEIDRLPRRPTAASRRGVEVHRRIELFNRGSVAFDEVDESFYDAVGDQSEPVGSAFTRFKSSRFADLRPILVEAPFDLDVAGSRVSGRIDAVYEPSPGVWEIVDFKSGRRPDDPPLVQLEAYAVAAAEAGFLGGRTPEEIRVTFAYLGDDPVAEVGEETNTAWIARARHHLEELIAAATSGTYPASPSEACRHCDFARVCGPGTKWLESHR